jgi:DNA-binding XRE family transcriptional regulator
MKQKIKTIFATIGKAKVSMTDFAKITGISRVTLYRWKNGGPINDKIRLNLAYGVAIRFNKACEDGKLPLANKLKAVPRVALLRSIVSSISLK